MSSYTNDEGRHQLRGKPVPSGQEPTDDRDRLVETASEPLLPGDDTNSSREAHRSANASHLSTSDDETDQQHQPQSPSLKPRIEEPQKQPTEEKSLQAVGSCKASIMRICGAWWPEIICCILSFVALVAMIILLAAFDGKSAPDLPSGITVNTLVALLSTMARTAFVISVAEGLSQSKWNWFKRKPRPLEDFDVFDQASRGPWGSLCLILRTRSRLVGMLSALLLISGIATSTLTQSAVAYPSRDVGVQEDGSAVARRLYSTNWSNGKLDEESFLSSINYESRTTEGLIYHGFAQGVLTPPDTVLRFKEPHCKTSHCTWPRFSTLALCYKATNITHLIRYDLKSRLVINMTLPNGVSVSADAWGVNYFHIRPGPILSDNHTPSHWNSETAMSFFIFYWYNAEATTMGEPPFGNHYRDPRAVEVLFHMCVDTYDMAAEDNILSIKRVASHIEMHSEFHRPDPDFPDLKMYHFVTPADEGTDYVSMGLFRNPDVDAALRGAAGLTGSKQKKAAEQGRNTTVEDRDDAMWDAIEEMAHNVATSVTNSQIVDDRYWSWMTFVNGTAWRREVYVQVRWPWLSMLAAQILLSALLLAIVIAETAAADVHVVKSCVMAALLAIGADEKARLEREGAADEETRRLNPAGIGGELREKNGKWMLGGV